MSTGPLRKTAIAIPEDVLSSVDDAAREAGESRSRYITRVLRLAVKARTSAQITRQLDKLFAEPSVADDQLRTASDLDRLGSAWNDERW